MSSHPAAPRVCGDKLGVPSDGARPLADPPSRRRRVHRGTRSSGTRIRRRVAFEARCLSRIYSVGDLGGIAAGDEFQRRDSEISCGTCGASIVTFPNPGPLSYSHSALPTPNSRSGVRSGIRVLRSEVTFKDDGTGGAPSCVACASAVPRGSGANTCYHSRVHFSAREPSPPNGDGGLDANLPTGEGLGQSESPTPQSIDDRFEFFHLNVRGLDANLAAFDALVQNLDQPALVAVAETWLTKRVHSMDLTGYRLVSRLNRRIGVRLDRGGIALYARDDFATSVVHVGDSPVDERSWYILHCDIGPVLVCVWYRPPDDGEVNSIWRFEREFDQYFGDAIAFVGIGDFNVHNIEWLRHSRRNTPEGTALEQVCCSHGWSQHVKDPTRGPYLLDLVISSFASGVRCRVVPGLHDDDHDGVLATFRVSIPAGQPVCREVFDFKHARWNLLKNSLASVDWRSEFAELSGDDLASHFTRMLMDHVLDYIPSKSIVDKSFVHPWLDDKCREAIQKKHAARGTDDYPARRDECSQTFLAAQRSYLRKTRGKLRGMSRSSRGWWKLSNSLLTKATTTENIPALQRSDGTWATSSAEKAAELASVFREKAALPEREVNTYSDIGEYSGVPMSGFLRIRVRTVRKLLKKLDVHSGTGPDRLPTRILRTLCDELALPITLLARKLLSDGCWPQCWREHWVHPIYKKKSRADGRNYRGVHLTAQVSKVIERAIGGIFIPWVEKVGAYGPRQFAYTKGMSYKDVLALNVCSWLSLMSRGFLVGVYCSDVSGAFDRVESTRLRAKLRAAGLHDHVVKFLSSWLEDRVSKVVVGGQASPAEPLTNSVFQGTVLGSPLWNLFYADARKSVEAKGYTESVFADDFNAWKGFVRTNNVEGTKRAILADLESAQKELHLWGAANQVRFDPSKESFHILHRRFHHGDDFKILGVTFDVGLLMHTAAREIATEAGWRLQTLLRARAFFTTPELMHLYKAQVLSFIESSTPGIYHAAASVLSRVDRVQDRFLRNVGLDDVSALVDYRLAPLCARRDIAMLGVLHKIALGKAPKPLAALFPLIGVVDEPMAQRRVRGWKPRHSRQLFTEATFESTDVMQHSLFGSVHLYNKLPQCTVDAPSARAFQGRLQAVLKMLASSGTEGWQRLFSTGWRLMPRSRFHSLFE